MGVIMSRKELKGSTMMFPISDPFELWKFKKWCDKHNFEYSSSLFDYVEVSYTKPKHLLKIMKRYNKIKQ